MRKIMSTSSLRRRHEDKRHRRVSDVPVTGYSWPSLRSVARRSASAALMCISLNKNHSHFHQLITKTPGSYSPSSCNARLSPMTVTTLPSMRSVDFFFEGLRSPVMSA